MGLSIALVQKNNNQRIDRIVQVPMKKTAFTFIITLLCLCAFPQERGFYSVLQDPDGKTWRPRDVLELEDGYLFALKEQSNPRMDSKMVKLSNSGELVGEVRLAATDTTINLCNLFPHSNDNSLVVGIGKCSAPDGSDFLMTTCFDREMSVVSQKLVPLPIADHTGAWLDDYRFLQLEEGYAAMLSFQRQMAGNEIKLCKVSNEGEITQVENFADTTVNYIANLFRLQDNPSGFGLFGVKQISYLHVSSKVWIYDSKLRLERDCNIVNWHEEDGNGHYYHADIDALNSMMISSLDGGYYISSRLKEYSNNKDDRSAFFAKTDSDFVVQPNFCVIGHFNDTVEAPAFFKSVDVNDNGEVYQCSMRNVNYDSWPYGSRGTHLVAAKADTDLNVVWQKQYLIDGNVYSAFQTIATSDGGCLIVGNVFDHNSIGRLDVFVLKINADGTVGIDEIQEDNLLAIYPNPANAIVTITGQNLKQIDVLNINGQCLASYNVNGSQATIDISTLPSGVFFVGITDGNGNYCVRKLVKE